MFIYLIECENGKYYVGKTTDCEHRFKQHCNNKGSIWTRLHKPLRIIDVFETEDGFDEDKYTKKFMNKYGIDNVRGGSYTNIVLSKSIKSLLRKELMTANDLCYCCGSSSHFAKECALKKMGMLGWLYRQLIFWFGIHQA